MTDQAYLRRLEKRLSVVRLLGFVGLVAVIFLGDYPPSVTTVAQWIVAPVLLVATATIFFLSDAIHTERARARLNLIALLVDGAVILAAVWLFGIAPAHWMDRLAAIRGDGPITLEAYLVGPTPGALLLWLLTIESALRYRLRGALATALVASLFFAGLLGWASQIGVERFNPSGYALIAGGCFLIAFLVGNAAQMWHQTQIALELHAKRLVELDRLRDRYVAITSHEIRGPLTAIITGIETIRNRGERMDAEMRAHVLDMVSQQANQLARLVDDLMIGSELEAGELSIRPEMIELEAIVQRGVEGAGPRRRQHHLELFVEPLRCEVDPYRISQMLRNLIENAYKYTPDRTRVVVSGKAVEDGVELEIADDGPGIPLEERDKLFEAFSRLQETVAGKEGVGLGLYVVSQLATAMDGRIDLASSSRGTSFTIRIPCRTEPIEHQRMGLISSEEV